MALVLGVMTRWTRLVLGVESLASILAVAGGMAINLEFRLAALAGLAALALIGPQRYALDTRVPALASWAGTAIATTARREGREASDHGRRTRDREPAAARPPSRSGAAVVTAEAVAKAIGAAPRAHSAQLGDRLRRSGRPLGARGSDGAGRRVLSIFHLTALR